MFPVILNHPYASDGTARPQVIRRVYTPHKKFRHMEFIEASRGIFEGPKWTWIKILIDCLSILLTDKQSEVIISHLIQQLSGDPHA
ncbi:MAG: hypothetical protein Q8K91_00625 [Hylemonella sp.]|nr:hypothetical protein [Hylemonella sp.]MDP1935689.1 hypothetical protein [Hylemonella sp.]